MKKNSIKDRLETGQVIPLIVLMLFVIIGMVALILDGGAIMSNRRVAQAAADAGALAGAQRACLGKPDAIAVAEYYALTNNNATTAVATLEGMQVTVNTTVEQPSFFAKIFGVETLKASAEATAGCYGVRGKAVVPLAWRCKPPGEGPFNPEYGCQMQTLSWDLIGPMVDPNWNPPSQRTTSVRISDYGGTEKEYYMSGKSIVDIGGIPPEQIYIVIDSTKLCIEDGGDDFQCDLDGDGKKDITLGGDRGWLYLTKDTNSISKWIQDMGAHPDFTLVTHIWLSGKSGADVDVYIKMIDAGYVGEVVLIPIYNEICLNDPTVDISCVERAHAHPPWPEFFGVDIFTEMRNQVPYYHIIAFAPFYVSCIDKKGECPGFRYAQTLNDDLKDNPVIEGYFLSDYKVSPNATAGCDINLGNCTISLSN